MLEIESRKHERRKHEKSEENVSHGLEALAGLFCLFRVFACRVFVIRIHDSSSSSGKETTMRFSVCLSAGCAWLCAISSAIAAPPTTADNRLIVQLLAAEPDIVTPTGIAVDERGVFGSSKITPISGQRSTKAHQLIVSASSKTSAPTAGHARLPLGPRAFAIPWESLSGNKVMSSSPRGRQSTACADLEGTGRRLKASWCWPVSKPRRPIRTMACPVSPLMHLVISISAWARTSVQPTDSSAPTQLHSPAAARVAVSIV